jgi:hypothetical protein
MKIMSKPGSGNVAFAGRCRQLLAALALSAAMAGPAMAAETSFKHAYLMRGQVLATGSGSVTVCVGKNDGAEVGQVLNVVRHVRTPSYGKKSGPRFRRQDVGQVTITEVFDEHYASAKVAKGSPRVNDTVELER